MPNSIPIVFEESELIDRSTYLIVLTMVRKFQTEKKIILISRGNYFVRADSLDFAVLPEFLPENGFTKFSCRRWRPQNWRSTQVERGAQSDGRLSIRRINLKPKYFILWFSTFHLRQQCIYLK